MPRCAAGLAWVVLASLSACCFTGANAPCDEACRTAGECRLRTDLLQAHAYVCYAGSDAECAASAVCRDEGRCAATEDGACVAQREVEGHRCARSTDCRVAGRCHSIDGACVPESDDDCRASLGCITQGRCTLSTGFCFALEQDDCQRSTGCALEGLCTWQPMSFVEGAGSGRCALTSSGSCAATLACTEQQRCTAMPALYCSEPCSLYYCGPVDHGHASMPCTELTGADLLLCAPDGRCMRRADGVCEHLP